MPIIQNILKTFGYVPSVKSRPVPLTKILSSKQIEWIYDKGERGYQAAKEGRLFADWLLASEDPDDKISSAIVSLRNRARDLYDNDDYAKRYVKLVINNVLGSTGIRLQMQCGEYDYDQKKFVKDTIACDIIENAWKDFCKKGNCEISGRFSFTTICKILLRRVPVDGEYFVRKVRSTKYKYNFKLQLIDPDYVDEKFTRKAKANENAVSMGVEYNSIGEITGFHLKKSKWRFWEKREFVPAADMIHIYDPEFADQHRAVSWLCQSIIRIKMLNGYEEATLVYQRTAASKMGIITQSAEGTQYEGDEKNAAGDTIINVEPGTFEKLGPGQDIKALDFNGPQSEHSSFIKRTGMGIAAGLGVSYHSLFNDLEGVNYSSIRQGVLEDREEWKSTQNWLIEWFIEPVFEEWLKQGLTIGAFESFSGDKLPLKKMAKFNKPKWIPRRWAWVDPLKDVQAIKEEIKLGIKTRTSAAGDKGEDFDDNVIELQAENEAMAAAGLDSSIDASSSSVSNQNNGGSDGSQTTN